MASGSCEGREESAGQKYFENSTDCVTFDLDLHKKTHSVMLVQ